MKYFITYGDEKFKAAKERLVVDAKATGEFDRIFAYGLSDLSEDLLSSDIINVPRGGGLWSWKPDIIWQTMQNANNGDIIVYCDAGCTIQKTVEWKWYWRKLEHHDIIAQRLLTRNDLVTRKELIEKYIGINGLRWPFCYQYLATVVVLVVGDFTRMLIKEWRDVVLQQPWLLMDVTPEDRSNQFPAFIENRHDQAVYSALIYKYLKMPWYHNKIYTCWDKIEGCTLIKKQAIRATRLRQGQEEKRFQRLKEKLKRFIKSYLYIPLYYEPLQWWNGR